MTGAEAYDLIVVGAGPAGSAAALSALKRRPDARILLLDRAPLGRDKVCGDGIAPHAAAELEALGVIAALPSEIVPSVKLVSPSGESNAAVTDSPGYVVPRKTFDERIARAAIAAGAEFRQLKVNKVVQTDAGVTINGDLHAPAVIAADGANSAVRRLVGEPANHGASLAVAIRGYAPTPAGHPHELLLRWDHQRNGGLCYAWAFPTAEGTSNVGYGMSAAGLKGGRATLEERLRTLLPEFDLAGVELTGHTLPLTVRRPRAWVGHVLLVGDAASLINPFTGEGIYSAIASGAMAGAAATDDPISAGKRYESELVARFGRQYRQTKALYPMINYRIVLDTVIRACKADRRMFNRLLEVGLGDSSFRFSDIARFGRTSATLVGFWHERNDHRQVRGQRFEPSSIPGIDGDWVGAVVMRKQYTAGLIGESVGHFVSSGTEASRGYLCAERVTGTLDDGRSGSFTVHHGALDHPDDPSAFGYIIRGTGTDDFADFAGRAKIMHDDEGPYFVFDLE